MPFSKDRFSRPTSQYVKELTDAQIQHLYSLIKTNYDKHRKEGLSYAQVADGLRQQIAILWNHARGTDGGLTLPDEVNVVLEAFLNAHPDSRPAPIAAPARAAAAPARAACFPDFQWIGVHRQQPAVVIINNYPPRRDPSFWDWMILSAYLNGGSHHHHHYAPVAVAAVPKPAPTKKSESDEKAQLYALLGVCAVGAIAALASALAAVYLLKQTVDNVERFVCNEGWLQATLSLSAMLASGAVSFMLADAFAAMPLIELGITAGLASPAGFAVFGVITLALVGGVVGSMTFNWIQKGFTHEDAIDPQDPHRFALTPAEDKALVRKGYDPLLVRCAIIALRDTIETQEIPSLMYRSMFSPKEVQEALVQVRKLRRGELPSNGIVKVGEMSFDCRLTRDLNSHAQAGIATASQLGVFSASNGGATTLATAPSGDIHRTIPVKPVVLPLAAVSEDDDPTQVSNVKSAVGW